MQMDVEVSMFARYAGLEGDGGDHHAPLFLVSQAPLMLLSSYHSHCKLAFGNGWCR